MKNICYSALLILLSCGLILSCSKTVKKDNLSPVKSLKQVETSHDLTDTDDEKEESPKDIPKPQKHEQPSQDISESDNEKKMPLSSEVNITPKSDYEPVFTLKELRTLNEPDGSVETVTFSKDGTLLATCGRHKDINIWDVESGKLLKILKGHTNTVESVDFSSDGKFLVSGSWDGTVRIWNVTTGWLVNVLRGHTDKVRSVAFSPDGHTIASGSDDKSTNIWNVKTGRLVRAMRDLDRRIKSVRFSPKGDLIASGGDDQKIKLWDSNTGRLIKTLTGHSSVISSLAFSPDGGTLVSGSWDTTITIWNVESGNKRITLKGHSISVRAVSFSPDGTLIASGSDDKTLKFWNPITGKLFKTRNSDNGNIFTIAFSPDGTKLASGGSGDSVKIWDIPFDLYASVAKDSDGENSQSETAADKPAPKTFNNTSVQGIPELSFNLILTDEDQNGVFDGSESMYIMVTAKNTGTAVSRSTRLNVEGIEPFHIPSRIFIGDIAPGKTIEKRFAYELPQNIAGVYTPKFILEDNKGFKSAPKVFHITAMDFKSPQLSLDYAVKDEARDGKLMAGVEAILYLYLRNTGGKAQNLKVNLQFPSGVYMIGKKQGMFSIDALNNGEYKELITSIVVSQEYAQKTNSLPVSIKIRSKETSMDTVLKLPLNQYIPSPEDVDVKPAYGSKKIVEPPVASSDIDRKIRDMSDPSVTDKDVIALVIGIDNYKNIPRSLYSTNDALLMSNLIKKYIKAEVVFVVTDQDASYLTIKDKFNYIAQNAKDKTIYIFYSGHGFSTEDKSPSIVPYDTPQSMPDDSLIPIDAIINQLSAGSPKKVIIITDSCFSGTDREGRSLIASARPIFNVPKRIKLPQNYLLLTATDSRGKSYSDKSLRHGIFTYYTALALTGAAFTDDNIDITGGQVYNYVRDMVISKTKKLGFYDQIPSINQDGEDVVIIIKDFHK
jgi:WD40 repeat protein